MERQGIDRRPVSAEHHRLVLNMNLLNLQDETDQKIVMITMKLPVMSVARTQKLLL